MPSRTRIATAVLGALFALSVAPAVLAQSYPDRPIRLVAEFPPDVDAIVYGCTHYPLLDAHFAATVPSAVRIDPAREQARAVIALHLPPGRDTTLYVTNGDVASFERNVRHWTGDRGGRVMGLAASSR